jgi:ABC-type multidrug transport system fused ATPase/permease subunit
MLNYFSKIPEIVVVKKIVDLLTHEERKQAIKLFFLILAMAFFDLIGVASILPFVAVLTNPGLIETNAILSTVYSWLGSGIHTFLIALGCVLFFLFMLSLGIKAATTYAQLNFVLMREYKISKRLIEGYLNQPFAWFLNRHSADLGKTLLLEVGAVVNQGLMPFVTLVAQSVITISLVALLLIVSPGLAISVVLILGSAYWLIIKHLSNFLSRIGKKRTAASEQVFKVVCEAFAAVKEVKVGGLEGEYVRRFSTPAELYAQQMAAAAAAAHLPRFVLEAIAFGGLMLVVLYLMVNNTDITNILPIVSLYALVGYRLMPALQLMYSSISQLRFVGPVLEILHKDMQNLGPLNCEKIYKSNLPCNQFIEIENVSFRYPNATEPVLCKLNIQIPAYSITGFVGFTGSGKTTIVDIILGLLEPQEGSLVIDGLKVTASNRRQWQKSVGYVPQHIYLADDSVAANIAFGVPPHKIDQGAVENAAKIANAHNFIIEELEHGYATTVGERGIRLSGGQRQRIGIARALYHQPKVLILDEATSALDNITENTVMEAVNLLAHKMTIILIAHRLSTIRQCDQIFLLDKGRIKAKGKFDRLLNESDEFREMVKHERPQEFH